MRKKILAILLSISILPAFSSEKTFNIAVSSLDLTLNPYYTYTADEAQYLTGIYEGLVSYDPLDLTPKAGLAESWEVSQDRKTYTFTLRENLTYNNGEPITAYVYYNSFVKILSPETGAEFASLLDIISGARAFRTGENSDINSLGIEVKDDRTLVFHLTQRAPYFTKILCHHSFTPVPPSLLNKREWDISEVLSSGPYTIERDDSQIKLTKNPLYWDSENIYYDTINIINYDDSNIATADYNSGKIDWLTDNTINLNSVSDLETINVNPLFATTYYYFNAEYREYKNTQVREAISLLIPWSSIRENQYIPATTLVPSLSNFPKNNLESIVDVEKALKLLQDAGYTKGRGLSDIIISVPEHSYNDDYIAKLIKSSVEEHTDITVIIKKTPYPDFFTINRSEEFTLSTLSWIGDFADPLTFLEMWTKDSNLNDSRYNNSEFDDLIENSSNLSQDERYKELSKAERILLNTFIVFPINHSPGINVIDRRYIENWYPNTLDIHPYKYLRVVDKQVIPGLI